MGFRKRSDVERKIFADSVNAWLIRLYGQIETDTSKWKLEFCSMSLRAPN